MGSSLAPDLAIWFITPKENSHLKSNYKTKPLFRLDMWTKYLFSLKTTMTFTMK